jgi:hypothetical protein
MNGQHIVPRQGPTIQQHGQAQGQGFNNYNQGYLPNNQGQGFNNQGQDLNVNNFTSLIKCLCTTIII